MGGDPIERAIDSLKRNEPLQALTALDGLPDQRQNGPEVLLLRGVCCLATGDGQRAYGYLSRAHQQKAGDPVITRNLITAILAIAREGTLPQAVAHYENVLDLDPANAPALLGLAHCLRESCDFADAAELYRAYLTEQADDVAALIGLGYCLQELRRHDEARAVYDRALALDPDARPLVLKSKSTASAGSISLTGYAPTF
ncbi:tetratricopeptide repeat protein [Lutimaribacter marinistellae]|uniref:Tetratricopeptide repeat protein n=1 Tax=Lutimaribacter marinistellae TaxID=1820329 RepID=A0ABV7TEI9_9RHOB